MRFLPRLIVLCMAIGLIVFAWYRFTLRPIGSSDERIVINIPEGMSSGQVVELLEEKGLIRSANAVKFLIRSMHIASDIKAGRFVLSPSFSAREILNILVGGKSQEMAVTIPEGYTVTDIDALLTKKGFTQTGAFLRCAQQCDLSGYAFLPRNLPLAKRGGKVEGYLFPDTYFVVPEDFSAEEFIKRLLHTFEQRVYSKYSAEIAASGHSLHEILAMASILEEESRTGDERKVIAGILWKRFNENRGLDVDATVRYIIEKPKAALTSKDLSVDSPYNTRKYRGLPPGPIANPGTESIEAALHPKDSPYYYYLHDPKGMVHYATTNDEHNVNKAKYLR